MDPTISDSLPPSFQRHISHEDLKSNSTLQSIDDILGQIEILKNHQNSIEVILDIGCNRGAFVTALGEYLGADVVYGIDIDSEMREIASERGITVFDTNIEEDPLPLGDSTVDLVLSFGLLEHLRYYDNLFEEVRRVLRNGWFWVTTPNLASWINRFALLTGHQPRNVELSQQRATGVLPVYKKHKPVNHVHAPTYGALIELLEYYGFEPIDTAALTPYQRSRLVALLDTVFGLRTSWSRRVSVLTKR
ncbi:putative S-adenosylmethionine-dependent methyltransferase [Natrialba magadii ATCC 43099]|uniref:S-adenosylmethionine-dependent methyltransferase n=1 Tax=Natrialba magadii (strain ATCC 43099 / DSM 3394 / CCM 3739 / CIP 104546 / IAM 13178 / JCM 8861 / NBRC 102185 / NCIMB 2190 / MS3) TaxID=547559 RepID=D3SQM0_NATMM|nr:class I SAM-dependent methyltransferase [Natrialba magadii]ADD04508.1 putative S-adenosylmethionine-dependent methyltransferase [Natrialba magadii ATCC 43099]ELY25165.1 type 11 methyltransferase [Natrialba magadii ATCC 43099]